VTRLDTQPSAKRVRALGRAMPVASDSSRIRPHPCPVDTLRVCAQRASRSSRRAPSRFATGLRSDSASFARTTRTLCP